MDKRLQLKLNAGRVVTGILRGFDPYMNIVLDDTVEEKKDKKNKIGMVVSVWEGWMCCGVGMVSVCYRDDLMYCTLKMEYLL